MRVKPQGKETPSITKKTQEYKMNLDSMREESRRLKSEIDLENRSSLSGTESYIARLQDQIDIFTRKIDLENAKLCSLDLELNKVKKEIDEKKKNINLTKDKKQSFSDLFIKVGKIEQKLDKKLQNYNQAVAENKKIRDQIDKLRRERNLFKTIHSNLEEETKKTDFEISDFSKQKQKNLRHIQESKKKIEDLQKEKELTLKKYETLIEDLPKYEKMLQSELNMADQELPTNFSLTTTLKFDSSPIKEVRLSKTSEKFSEKPEEAHLVLKKKGWLENLNSLVTRFRISEHENSSLFNYVDDMTSEIEKLEKSISSIKKEIEDYKALGVKTEEQKKKLMSELEVRISHTEARAEAYEKKNNKLMLTVSSLKPSIEALLGKVGLNNPLDDDAVEPQSEPEKTVYFFNIIEVRTSEIIQIYNFLKNPKIISSPFERIATGLKNDDRKKEFKKFDVDSLPVISDSPGLDEEAAAFLPSNVFFDKCIEREGEILRKK
jgi:chromosome segregation ATPase